MSKLSPGFCVYCLQTGSTTLLPDNENAIHELMGLEAYLVRLFDLICLRFAGCHHMTVVIHCKLSGYIGHHFCTLMMTNVTGRNIGQDKKKTPLAREPVKLVMNSLILSVLVCTVLCTGVGSLSLQ